MGKEVDRRHTSWKKLCEMLTEKINLYLLVVVSLKAFLKTFSEKFSFNNYEWE